MKDKEQIISLWKELGIVNIECHFSCGGDSMNDMNFVINDQKGVINNDKLIEYFNDVIYQNVEFYDASDGHYLGESGIVDISLEAGEEDFLYSKSSQSQWCEMIENTIQIELTNEQVKFVREKVLNINGSEGEFCSVNFKQDCILTDKDEGILEEIESLVEKETRSFTPSYYEGELSHWFTYTTNEVGNDLKLDGNVLFVEINNEVTTWKD